MRRPVSLLQRAALRAALLSTLFCSTSIFSASALAQETPQGQAGQGQGAQGQGAQGQGAQGQAPGTTPRMVVDPATDTVAFSMNETNGMELPEFIKWACEVTGRNFTFSEQELQNTGQGGGRVSFLGTLRIKRDRFKEDFYSFFQTMLYIKGFAVLPRGEGALEIQEIVSMNGPRNREITNGARYVTPDAIEEYRNQTGVPILTTVQLKSINATIAQNALRPFFASTGAPTGGGSVVIGGVGNNTAMLLQGFGPQVYAAVKLLELVDVPVEQPNLVVQVVVLDNAAPEELEPILTEVLESRSKIRQQVMQENAGQGGGANAANQPQLKIVTNSTQKALVLSGTQQQVVEALDLIARLDVPGQPIEGTASVIRLKNVLAKDLRDTLHTFMQEDNQAETQAQQGQQAGASQARRTRRTVIQNHDESNSLLISAAATKYKQILALIDHLDTRQPQVLIEAALVELTTGDLDRFGIELGLLDLKANGDFTRPFGFSHFGQSGFEDTDDDGLPDTRLPDFENPLQGLTGGIISGGDFAMPMLINALSSDDTANILSLPSVLVNNNETAVVKTEEERPTLQNQQNNTGTQQSSGQPRNAGITLEISPTISPNNYLRLNISLEVSRFVGAFDPTSATGGGVTLRRSIKTQVTMPSNATMVLGGVIEDSESYNDGGVPLLKDIPILGFFFRKSESKSNKTNLYFFVTPSILEEDDFQDLYRLSLQKKLEAQDYIGERRLRIIDRKWTGSAGAQARTIEDTGSTVEDIDAQGGYDMPVYNRGSHTDEKKVPGLPTAPLTPVRWRRSGGPMSTQPVGASNTVFQDRIREGLLRKAGLNQAQIDEALQTERDTGQQLDQVLVTKNLLPEGKCLQFFAEFLGLEFRPSLEGVSVPSGFIHNVPVQFARTHGLVAVEDTGSVLRVATHRPLDVMPMDDLATMLGREVEAVLASKGEIASLINRAYRHKADGVDEALQDVKDTDIVSIAENIQESEDLLDANKAPVIKLVNMLLFQALKLRASDIHLQPYGDRLQVRMRIDGVLYDMESVPRRAQEAIISRVKVMGKMDIAERRLPQDGRASIRVGDGDVDVRISTVPVAGGERVVFRILDKTTKIYSLGQIGLSTEAQRTIERYIHYSHGVIFVTGPTGSGKTTTLYGCLDAINAPDLNILTIEDPVEYNLDGISQVQVNVKKGLTFAAGLRSFLRQDPDVMMVGEVRDNETADIAIRAALTGHLVFSTVHTNDSASTVTRLIDIGVEPYLVSSSLLLVIAQRLLRTVCPNCREPVEPDQKMRYFLEDLKLTPDHFPGGKLMMGKGCDECFRSGYSGRTAIYEVMPIDTHIQEQIVNKATASQIKRGALERGLKTLRMDGVAKLLQGMTTPDEVLRVTQLDVT